MKSILFLIICVLFNYHAFSQNAVQDIKIIENVDKIFNYTTSDATALFPDLKTYLDTLVIYLKGHPGATIAITGHSDDQGTFDQNDQLARKRAQNAAEYLINQGIRKQRIIANGSGSIKPIASNKTESGRMKNRRIEIRIVPSAIIVPKSKELEPGIVYTFYYSSSSAVHISSEINDFLDKAALYLTQYPDFHISIKSHSDDQGTFEQNESRAKQRAENAANYLKDKGIEEHSINIVSRGSLEPLATNKTKNGRQKNRRIEFMIIPKVK